MKLLISKIIKKIITFYNLMIRRYFFKLFCMEYKLYFEFDHDDNRY